jgi:uncharacterized protein
MRTPPFAARLSPNPHPETTPKVEGAIPPSTTDVEYPNLRHISKVSATEGEDHRSMHITESRSIAARPDQVWTALFDPDVLKACIPGCESLAGSLSEGYEAVVVQKVGPVSARFTGLVTMSDVTPGQHVTITGEGKGGAAGFAKGGSKVTLTPEGEGTLLAYDVEVHVGGKLAQLGSRIIDGFARKMADQFFERFQTAVEGPKDPEPVMAGEDEAAPKKRWLGRLFGKKSGAETPTEVESKGGEA